MLENSGGPDSGDPKESKTHWLNNEEIFRAKFPRGHGFHDFNSFILLYLANRVGGSRKIQMPNGCSCFKLFTGKGAKPCWAWASILQSRD